MELKLCWDLLKILKRWDLASAIFSSNIRQEFLTGFPISWCTSTVFEGLINFFSKHKAQTARSSLVHCFGKRSCSATKCENIFYLNVRDLPTLCGSTSNSIVTARSDNSSFALFNRSSCSSDDQYFKAANAMTNSHAKVATASSPAFFGDLLNLTLSWVKI